MDPDGQVEREGVFSLHVLRKDAQSILNVSIYIYVMFMSIYACLYVIRCSTSYMYMT